MHSDITHLNRQWIALVKGRESYAKSDTCNFILQLSDEKKKEVSETGFALFTPSVFKAMTEEMFYAWASQYPMEYMYLLILRRAAESSIPGASLRFGIEREILRDILKNPYMVPVAPWLLRYPQSVFEQANAVMSSIKVKMAIFRRAMDSGVESVNGLNPGR